MLNRKKNDSDNHARKTAATKEIELSTNTKSVRKSQNYKKKGTLRSDLLIINNKVNK